MENLGISFVSACSGGLSFIIDTKDGEIARRADDIEDGVYWVQRYGWTNCPNFSSSMDFASEYGFDTDEEAKELWESGVKKFYMSATS